jgi:hypothetical protein
MTKSGSQYTVFFSTTAAFCRRGVAFHLEIDYAQRIFLPKETERDPADTDLAISANILPCL